MKHLFERGVIVIHILEEPLLGELWVGQGLCVGLDVSLLEVAGVGLVVKRVHTLFYAECTSVLRPSRYWNKCRRKCRR